MAGKRPTRPQIRSRRKALNSYLLSTESSYADLAKMFGVREETVKNFLIKDTKQIRGRYNSSPGYQKLYNPAAKNHKSDLKIAAEKSGTKLFEIPIRKGKSYRPPQVVKLRRRGYTMNKKGEEAEQRRAFRMASQLQEYARNVERDYNNRMNLRTRAALSFQEKQLAKGRPSRLYDFLDTTPEPEDIEDYMDDVIDAYALTESQAEAVSGRIYAYLSH